MQTEKSQVEELKGKQFYKKTFAPEEGCYMTHPEAMSNN
jgi:hypothetical protein